jgi:hypothetical protein
MPRSRPDAIIRVPSARVQSLVVGHLRFGVMAPGPHVSAVAAAQVRGAPGAERLVDVVRLACWATSPRECHALVQGKGGATANVRSNPLFALLFRTLAHQVSSGQCSPHGAQSDTAGGSGNVAGGRRPGTGGGVAEFRDGGLSRTDAWRAAWRCAAEWGS